MSAGGQLDAAALEQLYVRLEKPLFNVVYRWVWQREEAAELVQEAFVRLWDMRARVRLETVEPLVFQIAVNLARKRRRWLRLRTFFGLEDRPPVDTVAPVDDRLAALADAEAVRAAVDALPDRLKEPVMLCAFSDMTYRQVGEALGIPPGTVASRRNQALEHLRAALEPRSDR